MPYNLTDLDEITRHYMLEEFESDVRGSTVFTSAIVDSARTADYLDLQRRALAEGTPDSLAADFVASSLLNEHQANGAKVNQSSAASRLAGGQFGVYYARAVCARAVDEDREIEIYRARESSQHRPGSDAKIGTKPDPEALLQDLRENSTEPRAFSILPEVNSGITVRLI